MRHFSKLLIIIILSFTIFSNGCKPKFYNQITISEIKQHIDYLASDSLKGRLPGTIEDSLLVNYIAQQMDLSGLLLKAEDGLQTVNIERGFHVSENNFIETEEGNTLQYNQGQLSVFGFSASGSFHGNVIISSKADFDFSATEDENIFILPYPSELPEHEYDAYRELRSVGLSAADNGASGVILVSQNKQKLPESDQRLPLQIPVFTTTAANLSEILPPSQEKSLTAVLNSINISPSITDYQLKMNSKVVPDQIKTFNTVAELKGGENAVADEFIIIGAHHDHLGMGGRGTSSRVQDTTAIHYGADDNASGVAGIIELSQHLISRSPSRSFIFTTFAAEEMGLQGSKEFVNNPPVEPESVQIMINLDMIGRLNDNRQLQIGGVGTSPSLRQILDSINMEYDFSIAYSEAGYGPSDHSSFYAKDIPVLFITTGAHGDYHTPEDTKVKINYEGMQEVLSYISDVAYTISEIPDKLAFTLAGPKESSGSRGRREGMVTFGLMPDVMYDGNEGMPVSFVTEGKPAAIGGMKGGDIITAVDGKQIGNVHDYMERLSDLKEGQSVIVSVNRDGEALELLLKL
ncbi:MAG TPA: M28 family peptidase [Bacteroidales bacterium]|nr:M28 family peptidase [Bacteroidales bacterium]